MIGRDIGIAGGACALVLGGALIVGSVSGLVHDRDRWRALALRPAPTMAPPVPSPAQSAGPVAGPSAGPSPSPTPTPRVIQAVAASSSTGGAATPQPARSSTPAPRKSTPPRCPAATVTLRLPVGVLPCNAAVIGGSR